MNPPPTPAPPPAAAARALTLPVMGIPVVFRSPSAEVLSIAEEAFGAWRALPEAYTAGSPVHVDVRVVEGDEGRGRPPIDVRVLGGGRLALRTPGSRGAADAARGRASARVTPALLADRAHVRYGVLECLALWLVTHRDRQPLHAAALVRGPAALLLAGRSGVGKSTLVYAAMRAGMRVLAEDCVFLEDGDGVRVWGMPGFVHPMPDAARWFPELAAMRPALRANGKTKLAVDVRAAGSAAEPRPLRRAGICLLSRGGAPGLEPLDGDAAAAALTGAPEPGFDLFADTVGAPLRRLVGHGGWRLTLPPSPVDAVPFLHRMFDALEAGG